MPVSVAAPDGAEWLYEEVKTKKGEEALGEVPILKWNDVDKASTHLGGAESILNILDGTSLRVSYQSIARRGRLAKKTDDEIATLQVAFKPGARTGGGKSTPESRVARKTRSVVESGKVSVDDMSNILELIASGKLTKEQLAGLAAQANPQA